MYLSGYRLTGMIILLNSLLGGCVGDYSVPLPGAYELIRTNASTTMIWSPKGVSRECIVPPRVDKVGIVGDFIVGLVVYDADSDAGYKSAVGYFILDTRLGQARLALDEAEWVASLQNLGLGPKPTLWSTRLFALRCMWISELTRGIKKYWGLACVLLVLYCARVYFRYSRSTAARGLRLPAYWRCSSCGYVLKGLELPRCPECGSPFHSLLAQGDCSTEQEKRDTPRNEG